jgi:hypothetical protein
MKLACTTLLAVSLLAACTPKPEVSEAELARAVETILAAQRPCIADKAWVFPTAVPVNDAFNADRIRALQALEEAGLLSSTDTTTTSAGFSLGPDGGSRDETVPAKAYRLTDAGTADYRTYESPGYGNVGAFCYGRWEIDVLGFTEPAESEGNMTTVTYSRRLADVPAWAEHPLLRTRSNAARRGGGRTDVPAEDRITLMRTDSAWVHAGP